MGGRIVAVGAALILLTCPAWAQVSSTPLDFHLRVEWEAGQTRGGSPTVSGYVYNGRGIPADNVRLQVEALDAAGQVVGKPLVYLNRSIPAFDRAYFTTRGPTGATYRFTLLSVDWRAPGPSAFRFIRPWTGIH